MNVFLNVQRSVFYSVPKILFSGGKGSQFFGWLADAFFFFFFFSLLVLFVPVP